jgi:hypothetical protein
VSVRVTVTIRMRLLPELIIADTATGEVLIGSGRYVDG